jgi:RNA polymerase sigma-70 factor (ECF subfamily)
MRTHYPKLHAVEVDDKPVVPTSPALPKPHDFLPSLLPALRSFLTRFMRNAADAPDIAQEAAMRALGARDVPQDQRAYRAWLYQIARNVAIDSHRRTALAEAVESDQINPWTADRSLINTIAVRQALMQISEDQRTILLLVDVEERSYSEAARLLGIPAGTVMSRVSRARAALLAVINAGDETE